ncbi:hypothetical protein EB796_019210 [Bugula neritina]|uniref:Uncharacterized protein n=1 Tax=Bugula neritina TaxID=10212 RepID=A0A7J7J902_BUGNE|nr:hypothetical protein EB796_019210 [Bugula neritina]
MYSLVLYFFVPQISDESINTVSFFYFINVFLSRDLGSSLYNSNIVLFLSTFLVRVIGQKENCSSLIQLQ